MVRPERLRVYPIVDLPRFEAGRFGLGELPRWFRAALDGGATMLQLRDKSDRADRLVAAVARYRELANPLGVPLIVNDRVRLALALGADGVHIGQHDDNVETVRRLADRAGRFDFLVGVSVQTPDQAVRAARGGASYVSASPVFGTATKNDLEPPIGLAGLAALRAAINLPLVAIGGIDPARVASVLQAGADGVAFVSGWDQNLNPKGAIARYRDAVLHAMSTADTPRPN